jgi:hypothetical protein
MRPRLSAFLVVACLLVAAPRDGCARSSRLTGLSVERFYGRGAPFSTLTYRRTQLGRDAGGGDLACGLVPAALNAGVILLALDFGIARSLPAGPATLLLKAGTGNIVAVGLYSDFYLGIQAGVGVLVPLERRAHLRVDVSRRLYLSAHESFPMWSIGAGIAVRPP